MAATVVASNILVQFLFGQWLTWGAFTYPIAFLITDVMNRVYGSAAARRVVLVGFVTGVACSLIGTQIIGEFGPLAALRDGKWWRAPLASTLIGSVVDTALFFTIAFSGALAWIEPGNDTSWAQDMLPLLGLGPLVPLWVSLALADWLVKLGLALLALIPFRFLVTRLTATPAR